MPGSSVGTTSLDMMAQRAPSALKSQEVSTTTYPQQRYEQQLEHEAKAIINDKPETLNVSTSEETDKTHLSRGREKKRDDEKPTGKRDRSFFSELRKRLSGRKSAKRRAKSFDTGTGELEEAVSLPPSRDQSRTRFSGKLPFFFNNYTIFCY
ncbi:unnamed protein product [Gongylonema pulchrum]|uniref:Uncharacterized protein n=1 Tax=Gongylonema pulchrum TaxID=637853 RepID=A0A183EVY1_9BILA|nr:unnamed protein product [Gongylonema pulchrum]